MMCVIAFYNQDDMGGRVFYLAFLKIQIGKVFWHENLISTCTLLLFFQFYDLEVVVRILSNDFVVEIFHYFAQKKFKKEYFVINIHV
jgi:hypothetical protein